MQFKLTIAVAAFAIAGASHAAQAGAVSRFTEEDVSAILKAAGATDIKTETVQNEPRLEFKMEGVTYVADFYICKGGRTCELLQFAASFEPAANESVETVNAFNASYMYGKAFLDAKKNLVSVRTINGSAGSSTEQVAAELRDFIGVTKLLLDYMKQSAPTASYTPNTPAPSFALGGQQGPSGQRPPPPLNNRR